MSTRLDELAAALNVLAEDGELLSIDAPAAIAFVIKGRMLMHAVQQANLAIQERQAVALESLAKNFATYCSLSV